MIIQVIKSSPELDQRVRVLLVDDKVIIYTMPLNLDYDSGGGVSAITVQTKRDNPEKKATDYQYCLNAFQLAQEHKYFDAILMDEDQIALERGRRNIFWVIKDCFFTKGTGVFP